MEGNDVRHSFEMQSSWVDGTAVEYKLVFKEEDFYVKAKDGRQWTWRPEGSGEIKKIIWSPDLILLVYKLRKDNTIQAMRRDN